MELKFYEELDNNGLVDLGGWEHSIDLDIDNNDIVNLKTLRGYGDYGCSDVKTEQDLIELLNQAKKQITEILEKGEEIKTDWCKYFQYGEYIYDSDCANICVIDEIIGFLKDQSLKSVA